MRRMQLLSALLAALLLCSLCPVTALAAVPMNRGYTVADGGMSHSIALKSDGTVWGWGSNAQHQLGLADTANYSRPVQIEGLSSIVAVSAGYDVSAAVSANGRVYCWGDGQVKAPEAVSGLGGVVAVACGQSDFLALCSDGTVWTWQLGEDPTQVPGLSGIAKVAAGSQHFLALGNTGEVYAWGGNWNGQLGLGNINNLERPAQVEGLQNIVDIAAGYAHSLAVGHDGALYAWGSNTYGQLMTGDTENRTEPGLMRSVVAVRSVAAGYEYGLYGTSRMLYASGYGAYGQIGNNAQAEATKKAAVVAWTSNEAAQFVAAGLYHGMAVTGGGELYTWGRNKDGQVGTGRAGDALAPKRVLTALMPYARYESNQFGGASGWAVGELAGLYEKSLFPPELWQGYTREMTRAEFARLLVITYEAVKGSAVSYQGDDGFADLEGHPLAEYMRKANRLGIMEGVSETAAAPDANVTRQEAAKMLCNFMIRLQGGAVPESVRPMTYYDDADEISDWAIPYVAYAYSNQIMTGTETGFSPHGHITMEQGFLMVARLAEKYGWRPS